MPSPINNFLKSKMNEQENNEFKNVIPDFLLLDESITTEIKKINKNDLNELFNGVFLALNQLGEKLFNYDSTLTVNDEFKQKIVLYNPKAEQALSEINDLIFSDMLTSIETQYKENGLTPFYIEKLNTTVKKSKQNLNN